MEQESVAQLETEKQMLEMGTWYAPLARETSLSKSFSFVLIIILPFVGFWLGVLYQQVQQYDSVATTAQPAPTLDHVFRDAAVGMSPVDTSEDVHGSDNGTRCFSDTATGTLLATDDWSRVHIGDVALKYPPTMHVDEGATETGIATYTISGEYFSGSITVTDLWDTNFATHRGGPFGPRIQYSPLSEDWYIFERQEGANYVHWSERRLCDTDTFESTQNGHEFVAVNSPAQVGDGMSYSYTYLMPLVPINTPVMVEVQVLFSLQDAREAHGSPITTWPEVRNEIRQQWNDTIRTMMHTIEVEPAAKG